MMQRLEGAQFLTELPKGSKVVRKADRLDRQVDPARVFLIEKPDGTVWWVRTDGTWQPFIRDN